jgi:hypothetical protein
MEAVAMQRPPRPTTDDQLVRSRPWPDIPGARRPTVELDVALSLRVRLLLWLALQVVCLVAQAAELLARQQVPASSARAVRSTDRRRRHRDR